VIFVSEMIGEDDHPSQPSKDTPTERANYVVRRLSDAVAGPTDDDWAQVRSQLTRAYKQIVTAQGGYRLRAALRWVVGITCAYLIAAVAQWQIDSLWGLGGVSARTFYLPALIAVIALFAFYPAMAAAALGPPSG
jgi:hypothetical protein